MSDAMVSAVAQRLIAGWRSGIRQPLDDLWLPDASAAYAVQRRVACALGWFDGARPNAWKLGGSPGMQLTTAPVPAPAIHHAGWSLPLGYVTDIGLEGELVIRLGRDLSDSPDLAEVRASIDVWLPGIELCDTRLENGASADPLLRLADQQLNRALILGQPFKLMEPLDWSEQTATLRVDGREVFAGRGSHPFVDPLKSLPWLALHAAQQGTPLRAGDLIATGSWTGIHWADRAQWIDVAFGKLGSVSMQT